jgi:hypothetical protein
LERTCATGLRAIAPQEQLGAGSMRMTRNGS